MKEQSINKPVAIATLVFAGLFAACLAMGADAGVLIFLAIPTAAGIAASTIRFWWPLEHRTIEISLESILVYTLVWIWSFTAYGVMLVTDNVRTLNVLLLVIVANTLIVKLPARINNLKTT